MKCKKFKVCWIPLSLHFDEWRHWLLIAAMDSKTTYCQGDSTCYCFIRPLMLSYRPTKAQANLKAVPTICALVRSDRSGASPAVHPCVSALIVLPFLPFSAFHKHSVLLGCMVVSFYVQLLPTGLVPNLG